MYRLARVKGKTATAADTSLVRGIGSAEDGFAVAMVLFIIIIVSLLGIAMLTVAAYQMRDADRTLPSNRAFDLADCGLSFAHGYLAQGNSIPDPTASPGYYPYSYQMAPGSTFDVTIAKDTDPNNNNKVIPYRYRILSTGSYQKNEGGASDQRTYTRKLEEVVNFQTLEGGYLDAFTYCMYSDEGDVVLDTGTTANNSTGTLTVDGNIYAGNDVNLLDIKANRAAGSLTVNGNVTAGQDVDIQSQSGNNSAANDSVTGDVTAGGDVSIGASTHVRKGASFLVGGSINSGGDVSLSSGVFAVAGASVKVAQSANTSVNAKGNVTLSSLATVFALPSTYVGNDGQSLGAASGVNADGDVNITADSWVLAASQSRVYGNVQAKGATNLDATTTGLLSAPVAEVKGYMKNNGDSSLSGTGPGWQKASVGGLWQHGGGCSRSGNTSFGSHSDVSPNIGDAPVQGVPDITWPGPYWKWYRTMAIAQDHYIEGDKTFTSDLDINYDSSSMWVMYVKGNVTIQNNVNLTNNGVIVCEGDFTVNGTVAMSAGSKYQVIARGNITHANSGSTNPNANDTVFLYTDGSYDSGSAEGTGNVTYDLAWFNTVKGQISAKGNINASAGNTSIANPKISYAGPSFPVLGWPLPFDVLSFREL